MTSSRLSVLEMLASAVGRSATWDRPVLVGIDGVDGAGKTMFADDLAAHLRSNGQPVLRVSIDGFHRPAAERYRLGRRSPVGFFAESYDYDAFRAQVLDPLAPGGSRLVRTAIRDVASDAALDLPARTVSDDTVVVADGIFLHRDELVDSWDVSVFLDVSFAVTFRRMAVRDGCPADPADPANARYLEGQRLYLSQCRPQDRATYVIGNEDPRHPIVR